MSKAQKSAWRSCLYLGRVTHQRLRPRRHRFAYRVFSLYLELDELPALDRGLKLFSHNRFNLFSFQDRDHGPGDGRPLRPWIEGLLAGAGIDLGGGSIRLLCYPRILGYVFNPISLWFCEDAEGALRALLYEVHNTFGERHGYLLPIGTEQGDGPLNQACAKTFHVSPFLPMDCAYAFRLRRPDERLSLVIRQTAGQEESAPILVASQQGRRRGLTDRALAAAFLAYPLMTLKVTAAIHWEALRLWLKGVGLQPKPAREGMKIDIAAKPGRKPRDYGVA